MGVSSSSSDSAIVTDFCCHAEQAVEGLGAPLSALQTRNKRGAEESPVRVQMWQRVSPVPMQMWQRVSPVPVQMWHG
jgi:hypothetical protein